MRRTKLLSVCLAVAVLALCRLTFSTLNSAAQASIKATPVAGAKSTTGAVPAQSPLTGCCLRRTQIYLEGVINFDL